MGFSPKGLSDSESSMSPTSVETTHFSNTTDKNQRIGLALVDILYNDNIKNDNKLFIGSQLKIQIPSIQSNSMASSPQPSPIEFGVKTKDSQLALYSSPLSCDTRPCSSLPPELLIDMELSEEYTCIISHGPNPKITHIFDNFIVESSDGNGFVALRKESECFEDGFLSFCHSCKKNLSQGKDIFMYRGEKTYCSEECRRQ